MSDNAISAMNTQGGKLIYPELSYAVTGALFDTHNEIGRYGIEKQYNLR